MRAYFTLVLLFISAAFASAQITITSGDFAGANDTDRVSVANIPSGLNYRATGEDTTWDYSFLQWSSQRVDKMLNPVNTNAVYAVYYADVSFNSKRSNLATPGSLNISSNLILPFTVNNEYNFFYKNSSMYIQQGIGLSIDGIPTNVAYSHRDTLYHFPLRYGNTDQCNSDYHISVPYLGTFAQQQTRTNKVDGWGTLTTPFGTFDVLRVFTQIASSDSFYVDTFHAGIKIPLPTQREYKWIGIGQKEPLLQINTQVIFNIETISSIVYRDSVRNLPTGINEVVGDLSFNVYPNPATSRLQIYYPANEGKAQLTVTDLNGSMLLQMPMANQLESVDVSQWARGMYLITITDRLQTSVRRIVIQ